MSLLQNIKGPDDVKALDEDQLPQLAQEIRDRIINVTACNGGHIGPNLGVVELTLAMHRVFDTPIDQFVFDVAHQGYVHKLLTGRNGEDFDKIRHTGGVAGFLNREESVHDAFGAGHAGTALSAALGMAAARDLKGDDNHVVAVIGDAALTCGITMEALNNISHTTKRLIVILNDNEWSIAKNVGAISKYLNDLITNPFYNRVHDELENFFKSLPGGDAMTRNFKRAKMETKDFLVHSSLFEHYGLRYVGPLDGHDIKTLIQDLEFAKNENNPILLHVMTKKGKGYDIAINNPEKFHGTGAFDPKTGKSEPAAPDTAPKYQDVFGDAMVKLAKADKRVVGITAAMPSGTGLNALAKELPKQFFDVGIAEEHAVLSAAGMATQGLKPVCGIYSTFLQRSVDQVIHDVCLQKLPVMFCMDRAGLAAQDGPTHHGLFDLALFRPIPNTILMQPKDEDELCDMMFTGLQLDQPTFVRYPRGNAIGVPIKETPRFIKPGTAERLQSGDEIAIWALGPWVQDALRIAEQLKTEHHISTRVVNARYVKPLDTEKLLEDAKECKLIVTMEDHIITGGLGTAVIEELAKARVHTPVEKIGWPDHFVPHASNNKDLRKLCGLMDDAIVDRLQKAMGVIAKVEI